MIIKAHVLLIAILILPIISADLFPTPRDIVTVGIGGGSGQTGVNVFIPDEIFNSSAATSNSTKFWLTSIGALNSVDAVQFNNVGGVLTIDETFLESFGNDLWLRLDGANSPIEDINWDGFNLDDVGNITILDKILLNDTGHWIKLGADGFNGLSTEAFSLQHSEERGDGTITFIVSFNKTNSDIDGISIMAQAGLNNSGGYLGNSWMIAPNNLTNNLTDLSNCFFVINATGNIPRISCDTDDTGSDLFVQDDIQSGGTVFADGGIRAETLVNFIMNGEDVNIQNGGLHIFTPVIFERGVVEGDEVTIFIEDFTGGLGSFINLQEDLGNWFPTANILCDDGDCANSVGISGVGNIIMEANISTVNINSTSLNFIYSLVNIIGVNDFEVTVNNNVGSGEIIIFTDSTTNVVKNPESIALPASMSNQPKVSIRFNCDVTNANRQCFVDTIRVNGTAIATTLTNVSGFDSVIKFGDGVLAADGFPKRGIIYNASGDTIIIRGNATFENIIQQDLNITNSIELNGTTIFDWGDVVNSPNFLSFLLANGSTPLTSDWEAGAFTIISVSADFESIVIDDITEKTPGNNVVFGSNINLGSNNLVTSGDVTADKFITGGSEITNYNNGIEIFAFDSGLFSQTGFVKLTNSQLIINGSVGLAGENTKDVINIVGGKGADEGISLAEKGSNAILVTGAGGDADNDEDPAADGGDIDFSTAAGGTNIGAGGDGVYGNFILNKNGGKVGIGTSSPTHTLNVIGAGNFTGDIFGGDDLDLIDDITIGGDMILGSATSSTHTAQSSSDLIFQVIKEVFGSIPNARIGTRGFDTFLLGSNVWSLGSDGDSSFVIRDENDARVVLEIDVVGDFDFQDGDLITTGNIIGDTFIGSGSQLTGININGTHINVLTINSTSLVVNGNSNITGNLTIGNHMRIEPLDFGGGATAIRFLGAGGFAIMHRIIGAQDLDGVGDAFIRVFDKDTTNSFAEISFNSISNYGTIRSSTGDLRFESGGDFIFNDDMRIGQVSDTNNPIARLEVYGEPGIDDFDPDAFMVLNIVGGDGVSDFGFGSGSGVGGWMNFTTGDGANNDGSGAGKGGDINFNLGISGTGGGARNGIMFISPNGVSGLVIGTSNASRLNATNLFHVEGSATSTLGFLTLSDRSFKSNIKLESNSLSRNAYSYTINMQRPIFETQTLQKISLVCNVSGEWDDIITCVNETFYYDKKVQIGVEIYDSPIQYKLMADELPDKYIQKQSGISFVDYDSITADNYVDVMKLQNENNLMKASLCKLGEIIWC